MPTDEDATLLFVGAESAGAGLLARSLAAGRTIICPSTPAASQWDWDWAGDLATWRRQVASLPAADCVVVCTWQVPVPALPLADVDAQQWRRQVEWPTALWFSTLVAAAERCRDGGSVVAVVERPATLDAIGQAPVVAVADGVLNLTRSLAAQEGMRGVRVNAVITSLQTSGDGMPGAAPPLAAFPGRIEAEVVGAVRLLLSNDAVGLTGSALSATCGRR